MIGEQLSHYVLEAKLGEGTYGVVYRGVHTADPEIRVAVKVMQPWHVGDEKFMESLKAECRRLDKLDHPNLVRFRELVVQGGQVAMVLELLEGQDMFDAAKARRFSLAETVRVIE
jgi:serine/threonine-protein kinase